jgi:hypothetical protein
LEVSAVDENKKEPERPVGEPGETAGEEIAKIAEEDPEKAELAKATEEDPEKDQFAKTAEEAVEKAEAAHNDGSAGEYGQTAHDGDILAPGTRGEEFL